MSSAKSQNLLTEIKKYFKTANQLNILLKETHNACKDTKILQQPTHLPENIQLNEVDENFIKSLKNKKISLVISGQNVLAKAIIVNELLSRYLLPFQIRSDLSDQNWRFIRIKHGKMPSYSYQLVDSDFEVMTSDSQSSPASSPSSSTFSLSLDEVCLNRTTSLAESNAESQAILEITLDQKLLEQNFEILVHNKSICPSSYQKLVENSTVIYIYAIIETELSETDLAELAQMEKSLKNEPIFFVKIPEIEKYLLANSKSSVSTSQPSSPDQHQQQLKRANNFLKYLQNSSQNQTHNSLAIFGQLYSFKHFNIVPSGSSSSPSESDYFDMAMFPNTSPLALLQFNFESEFCEKWHLFLPNFVNFIKRYLELFLVRGTKILFKFHEDCLKQFINFAFEVARDMMVTPRKIEYARDKEHVLFESLNALASINQEELKIMINEAIESNRAAILEAARNFEFDELDVELVQEASEKDSVYTTVKYARDYKKCSSQIQELVINKLNSLISQKLTQSVQMLKENYYGTLKRCLINLEDVNSQVSNETSSASVTDALQQILNSAYQVDVNLSGSSNILKMFLQKMKELVRNMPWSSSPKLNDEWKISIANNMLDNLSESKLAKILCNQMKDKLRISHCQFTYSLKLLEAKHTGRLEKNEENQSLIRKVLAPKFAKLGLESTSLEDYVLYGFPNLGKEIGRGQYGVVYSCHKWGKHENLAVKSVVPPDEKHWNDLALEFHYTKQIADHDRIVKLIGSVIDYTYGNGSSPAVLLIMEAMKRDLYQALKSGLDWKTRLQISIDVVDGIRYLHGLGLIHRDIKLKNVLLDLNNRAKITDLGFCKPNAMISGSIVGTPVHMCPKMFDAKYDNSVDIYAFGILFWYICAGSVSLPKNFEQCSTKDDLWSSVKRGVRPERLAHFDQGCWNLMEMCWHHEPKCRPHIGEVAVQLDIIKKKYPC